MDGSTRRTIFCFGCLGGILPTLANLASLYVANPETPLPAIGLYFGLGLWAVIGGTIALTNSTPEMRQAIFAGIAAPAILTSLVSGASEAAISKRRADLNAITVAFIEGIGEQFLPGRAFAQAEQTGVETLPKGATEPKSPLGPTIRHETIPPDTFMRPLPPKAGFGDGWYAEGFSKKNGQSASTQAPAMALINTSVDGGAPYSVDIPVFANVRSAEGTLQTVRVGSIHDLGQKYAFALPPGAQELSIGSTSFVIGTDVTNVTLNVKTRPSAIGDFFWTLGVPRNFKIEQIDVRKIEP